MGLDITAYRRLSIVPDADLMDDYPRGFTRLYEQIDFPERMAPLTPGVYRYAEEARFRAGSYGGYSVWREQLAALAGYTPDDVWSGRRGMLTPFAPLVNFSDCEGVIGTDACRLLLDAFESFQSAADEQPDSYFREKYAEWRTAVTMAADGGCLVFH